VAVAFGNNLEFFLKIKQKVAVISSPHKNCLCSTEAHMRAFVSAIEGGERERGVCLIASGDFILPKRVAVLKGE
jgi:hypothetical protein